MNKEKQILVKYVQDIAKTIFGDAELHISVLTSDEILDYGEIEFDYLCKIKLIKGVVGRYLKVS